MTNIIDTDSDTEKALENPETDSSNSLTDEEIIIIKDTGSYHYPGDYVDQVFMIWWKSGRPPAAQLHRSIPLEPDSKMKPTSKTLVEWTRNPLWHKKADLMDREVARQVQKDQVNQQIKMLNEHADNGLWMRKTAKEWIEEHMDEFTPSSAVRLLVEGVRIERESRGLDKMLENVNKLSDEKLIDEIAGLLKGSEMDFDIELDRDE